jgi:type IX secretion system PorP/SprF family membrane protein
MIQNLLFAVFTLISLSGFCQYVPISSQAFQFSSMYNPAFSGVDPFNDIRLGYRYQWAGLDGAPKSVNLTFNTRLKQPLDLTSNALRLSNSDAVKIPNGKLSIHGLSVNVFQLSYGQVQTIGGSLNYGFHYSFNKKLKLAAGVGAIVEKTKIDVSEISLRDPEHDPYYQQLLTTGASRTDLSVRAGLLLYSKSFYVGLSYLPLYQTALQNPGGLSENTFYRGSAQFGFSLMISPTFYLKPSVLALIQMNNGVNIDYSVKAYIGDRVWGGLSYRDVQAGVGMAGFNINDTFTVSYSYEMSLGKFKTFNDGSHELVLAVRLNNFRRQPSYTW